MKSVKLAIIATLSLFSFSIQASYSTSSQLSETKTYRTTQIKDSIDFLNRVAANSISISFVGDVEQNGKGDFASFQNKIAQMKRKINDIKATNERLVLLKMRNKNVDDSSFFINKLIELRMEQVKILNDFYKGYYTPSLLQNFLNMWHVYDESLNEILVGVNSNNILANLTKNEETIFKNLLDEDFPQMLGLYYYHQAFYCDKDDKVVKCLNEDYIPRKEIKGFLKDYLLLY